LREFFCSLAGSDLFTFQRRMSRQPQ